MKDKDFNMLGRMIGGIFLGGLVYMILIFGVAHWILEEIWPQQRLLSIFLSPHIPMPPHWYAYPPSLVTLLCIIQDVLKLLFICGGGYLGMAYPFQKKEVNNIIYIAFLSLAIPSIIWIGVLTIFHLFEVDIGRTVAWGGLILGIILGFAINWPTIRRLNQVCAQ